MTTRPTPLFFLITGADFTRAIKRSRSETNAVADQIREKLSSLAGQPSRVRPLGVAAVHGAEAAPLLLGTKYLNTLIDAKPAAQGRDQLRNSADAHCRGRLGSKFNLMKSRKLLIAATALLGLGAGQVVSTAPNARNVTEQRQTNVAVKNGTSARELKEDHFGGYTGSILAGVMKDRGRTPYEWGTSAACARMVRKNRMHARGISHSRI